jgi:hypothetical protein
MEPKKSHRANLEKRRAANFVVGLLISLSFVLISFEWTTIHPDLDSEALHVIKSSPLWEPGIQSGVKVSVTYIFPINFVLHH